jgi:Fe-S-cluster containining protein
MSNCEDCTLRVMLQNGCCTNSVGKGTKLMIDSETGNRVRVCKNLEVDEVGGLVCGDYANRPDVCRNHECFEDMNEDQGGAVDLPNFYVAFDDLTEVYAKYGIDLNEEI